MKQIKISVTTTYTVELEVNVSDGVYNALCKAYDKRDGIDTDSVDVCRDSELSAAAEWLADNIREKDSCGQEWEITDLEDAC